MSAKKEYTYYPVGHLIRAIAFIIVISIGTYFLSGFQFGCVQKVNGICTTILSNDYSTKGKYGRSYSKTSYFGMYEYTFNKEYFAWTDDRTIRTKPKEGKTYKLYINPEHPEIATRINWFFLITGLCLDALFVYALAYCIIADIQYQTRRKRRRDKR